MILPHSIMFEAWSDSQMLPLSFLQPVLLKKEQVRGQMGQIPSSHLKALQWSPITTVNQVDCPFLWTLSPSFNASSIFSHLALFSTGQQSATVKEHCPRIQDVWVLPDFLQLTSYAAFSKLIPLGHPGSEDGRGQTITLHSSLALKFWS